MKKGKREAGKLRCLNHVSEEGGGGNKEQVYKKKKHQGRKKTDAGG